MQAKLQQAEASLLDTSNQLEAAQAQTAALVAENAALAVQLAEQQAAAASAQAEIAVLQGQHATAYAAWQAQEQAMGTERRQEVAALTKVGFKV